MTRVLRTKPINGDPGFQDLLEFTSERLKAAGYFREGHKGSYSWRLPEPASQEVQIKLAYFGDFIMFGIRSSLGYFQQLRDEGLIPQKIAIPPHPAIPFDCVRTEVSDIDKHRIAKVIGVL